MSRDICFLRRQLNGRHDAVHPMATEPTLPQPVWDIVGAYAVSAADGLAAAAAAAGDNSVLKWVARVLQPPRLDVGRALRDACLHGHSELAFGLISELKVTREKCSKVT